MSDEEAVQPSITSSPGGPFMIRGDVPLVRKTIASSEHGEPMTWETGIPVETRSAYALCRCGDSANKPFCDGTHKAAGFEGNDVVGADATYADSSTEYPGTGIVVKDDRAICVHAGFCGNKVTNVWKSAPKTDDSRTRMAVITAIEKCPSGALTYRLEGRDADTEPDYPTQVGVIEDGPLWVTGGISVTNSHGETLEARNRVTLCRCGHSKNKPLCDGSHAEAGFIG